MTRKRVGQGLHEVFAETCEACNGRGYHIHTEPVEKSNGGTGGGNGERKTSRGGRARGGPAKPGPGDAGPRPAKADTSPVATEDPVEPAAAASQTEPEPVDASPDGKEPAGAAAEPVAKAPRRRRKAVSPVTTL
jgi:ribonuclease E